MMDWAGLKRVQKNMGVTYLELSNRTGYSYSHIKNAMGGNSVAGGRLYNALAEALGISEPYSGESPDNGSGPRRARAQDIPAPAPQPSEQFVPGKKYDIRQANTKTGEASLADTGRRLKYLRKEGKHHVFQCPTATWLTTFTDQQLVGMTWRKL